ncbi:MAG: hypothetical protein ACPGWR_21080 [Ardenticatenaceae bacterium]
MDYNKYFDNLKERALFFLTLAISGLINALFVVLWVVVQSYASQIVATFTLEGTGAYILLAFQIIFPVATLIPVVMHVYSDIIIMWHRTQERIRQQTKSDTKQEDTDVSQTE